MSINVGVIGVGPWGKNHVRVYKELSNVKLKLISDLNSQFLATIANMYNVEKTADYKKVLEDKEIKAVSICVPADLHYKITKEALLAGKHVLVEKPFVTNSKDGEELILLAKKNNLKLCVGHIFRFDPAIKKIKEEIAKDTFGKVYYLSLGRLGLKKPRDDVGAILNYAVHDLDIMCDVLGKDYPDEITAITTYPLGREFEDLAIITAKFSGGAMGYTQVSWLMPKKIREFWLVGEKRSASIDTMNFEVEIFDAGIVPVYNDFGTFRLITKEGDSHKPSVKKQEPLKEQLIHFINCIENDLEPINSGEVGLRATKMAEAALLSAKLKKTVVFDKNGRAQ